MRSPSIAIAGATGAVGREMLEILESREFPHSDIALLASSRSAGRTVAYRGEALTVAELTDEALASVDIALFSAGGSISKKFAPAASEAGTTIVDNSSAFRMTEGVPLVVPEINASHLNGSKIIANPNCSTIIMLVPLTPIRNAFGIERIVVSTYQAASGAGAAGMEELEEHTRQYFEGNTPAPEIFGEPYAFNLFSHDSKVDATTGRNVEEQKMIDETRKIWGADDVTISATCIRVPVLRAHAESINVTLSEPATAHDLRDVLAGAPGVRLVDDRRNNHFPTPREASNDDDVLVGRIRPDGRDGVARDDIPTRHFDLFVCGDQLRKGAALNAVQIAELLID